MTCVVVGVETYEITMKYSQQDLTSDRQDSDRFGGIVKRSDEN